MGSLLAALLALPVVGTGESGAKPIAGDMIAALISLLRAFVATRAVDVLLVTKSRQMLSAAQATRRASQAPFDFVYQLAEGRDGRDGYGGRPSHDGRSGGGRDERRREADRPRHDGPRDRYEDAW